MQFLVTFKNMDSSPALSTYAENKLTGIITRFISKPLEAHVTFSIEGLNQVVALDVMGGDNFKVRVSEKADYMYAAIDLLADTLHTTLKRYKDRVKNHRGRDHVHLGQLSADTLATENPEEQEMPIDAAEIVRYEETHRFA